MKSRYEAYLNGEALSAVNPDIYIHNISYGVPSVQYSTFTVAKRDGARIHRKYTDSISVKISFEIHTYDIVKRQTICGAVARWARNGGELQTNDRKGQRLRCVCASLPVVNSVRDWTEALEMEFTAYPLPYWEEESYAVTTLTAGASGNGTLNVAGSVDGAFVEADIVTNASVSSVSLTVNGKTLTLSGLSVASGKTIKITYNDDMIQSIKVDNTSLLNKRTGVDDLVAHCGANYVSYTASASVTVTFKARGLWA